MEFSQKMGIPQRVVVSRETCVSSPACSQFLTLGDNSNNTEEMNNCSPSALVMCRVNLETPLHLQRNNELASRQGALWVAFQMPAEKPHFYGHQHESDM